MPGLFHCFATITTVSYALVLSFSWRVPIVTTRVESLGLLIAGKSEGIRLSPQRFEKMEDLEKHLKNQTHITHNKIYRI